MAIKIDISQNTPVLEPYDQGAGGQMGHCLIWARHGSTLAGVVENTTIERGTAYVRGYCDALQDVIDGEVYCRDDAVERVVVAACSLQDGEGLLPCIEPGPERDALVKAIADLMVERQEAEGGGHG